MSSALVALRQQLAELLEGPRIDGAGLATGVPALDALLAGGGLPRGRLTEVVGSRGSGKTTFVRRVVEEAVARGLWVAYVDAARTLAPRDWAHLGEGDGVWMIRPREAARGAWCADVLLRSGAFALVVVDGAPPLTRSVAVRLTRLAREAGAALLAVGEDERAATLLGGALRLRIRRRRGRREQVRRFVIAVEKGGVHQPVEVSCAIGVARRLCADPEVPDRRGVGGARRGTASRGGRRGAAPSAVAGPEGRSVETRSAGGDAGDEPRGGGSPRTLARKRRSAEGELERRAHLPPALRSAVARARSLG